MTSPQLPRRHGAALSCGQSPRCPPHSGGGGAGGAGGAGGGGRGSGVRRKPLAQGYRCAESRPSHNPRRGPRLTTWRVRPTPTSQPGYLTGRPADQRQGICTSNHEPRSRMNLTHDTCAPEVDIRRRIIVKCRRDIARRFVRVLSRVSGNPV